MAAESKKAKPPKVLAWFGAGVIVFGCLIFLCGIVISVLALYAGELGVLGSAYSLYDICGTGLGICAFGAAVSRGKRWHLFALLLIVFFGSLLIGLFSMVGRETNAGYYVWAVGGFLSLFIGSALAVYWEELLDG